MASEKLLVGLLLTSALVIVVKCSCPDEEDIEPCVCQENDGKSVLRCKQILSTSVLEKVAENSDGYRYDEVHIEDSTIQFIPKVVPEKIRTKYLAFRNMTLNQLIDGIPNTLDELKSLVLQKIVTLRGLTWEVFKNTKGLESLMVDQVPIPIIKEEFNTYVTHNLKSLSLQSTGLKEIRKGAFAGFGALQSLVLFRNNLTSLTRDLFPMPLNVEFLHFQDNKITHISEDFFTGMPNLIAAFFFGNLISRFKEPVNIDTLGALVDIRENPIKCDCSMKWVVSKHASNIRGTCEAPKNLKERSFESLRESDFDCY